MNFYFLSPILTFIFLLSFFSFQSPVVSLKNQLVEMPKQEKNVFDYPVSLSFGTSFIDEYNNNKQLYFTLGFFVRGDVELNANTSVYVSYHSINNDVDIFYKPLYGFSLFDIFPFENSRISLQELKLGTNYDFFLNQSLELVFDTGLNFMSFKERSRENNFYKHTSITPIQLKKIGFPDANGVSVYFGTRLYFMPKNNFFSTYVGLCYKGSPSKNLVIKDPLEEIIGLSINLNTRSWFRHFDYDRSTKKRFKRALNVEYEFSDKASYYVLQFGF